VDGAPPASLPVLLRLERRVSRLMTMARMAQLKTFKKLWRAQVDGHINDEYAPFHASAVLGVVREKESLQVEVGNADRQGVEALRVGIEAGAFSEIKSLSFLFSNLPDALLRLLLPAFARGAMPQLEELQVYANFAGDPFMEEFSRIVAAGGFPNLCVLDLSKNYIGDLGIRALAHATTQDGVLSRLYSLSLADNSPLSEHALIPLEAALRLVTRPSRAAAADLSLNATAPASLPSLAQLSVDARLRAPLRDICASRDILLDDETKGWKDCHDPQRTKDRRDWMDREHLMRLFPLCEKFKTWPN
jgi:hypothetical protein